MKKNNWKKGATLLGLSVGMLTLGLQVAKADESTINKDIDNFQQQLNSELSQTNAIYAKATVSQNKLKLTQKKIENLNQEIERTEGKYNSLKEIVAKQMRSMQAHGGASASVLNVVLNANDFHEAIQAWTNLSVILRAEDAQAKDLVDTQKTLETMQSSLLQTKDELKTAQADYQKQAENLEESIHTLKNKVADNQTVLEEMKAQAEMAKDTTVDEDADKPKVEPLASKKKEESKTSEAKDTTITTPSSDGGTSLTVSATAYSSDNGLGFITATGINLHQNPMCIAVDPSVIPLGKMVEVPGYGIAIAGDTGGAIKGNIIDVHLPTTAQAQAWGRKTIQINILS
ncbi:3D domain-containing protein [Lactococcus formosensis]|uniref:3D domain-containing protein n=1 Tax=Lactococcus formosensis TaxID=1281486 RepID=A0A9X4NZI8_9LACT|nr:3D domain-containing protein [Lactococcus formosensis]MDG6126839.1 3D domain-containing protein [Lactococcus formosensis]MDG6133084.1 3D domain-containing protein [Lactococcus formosensis]MDG6135189.1 3D domain-containing protein [Lactococcus formosensis]MDG6141028.1 3D domain-containing protein [Lactococcus formosensis]MDG6145208.1 3D domain-containing protein [Lactococcus formosensis]